jgi:hypothetical protein
MLFIVSSSIAESEDPVESVDVPKEASVVDRVVDTSSDDRVVDVSDVSDRVDVRLGSDSVDNGSTSMDDGSIEVSVDGSTWSVDDGSIQDGSVDRLIAVDCEKYVRKRKTSKLSKSHHFLHRMVVRRKKKKDRCL